MENTKLLATYDYNFRPEISVPSFRAYRWCSPNYATGLITIYHTSALSHPVVSPTWVLQEIAHDILRAKYDIYLWGHLSKYAFLISTMGNLLKFNASVCFRNITWNSSIQQHPVRNRRQKSHERLDIPCWLLKRPYKNIWRKVSGRDYVVCLHLRCGRVFTSVAPFTNVD